MTAKNKQLQKQQQIPAGNGRKKSKYSDKCESRFLRE